MVISHKQKMIMYLTQNNREKIYEYIMGYMNVRDILKETGAPRYAFYTAIEEINPEIPKLRKDNRDEQLKIIQKQILRSIPFVYLKFDIDKLFGRNGNFKKESIQKQKTAILRRLNDSNLSLNDFIFVSKNWMESWYKKVLIYEDHKKGCTGMSIARRYNVSTTFVYTFIAKLNDNNNRLIDAVCYEQERIIIENINILRDYRKGKTIENISKEYEIEEWLVNIIIDCMIEIDESVKN